MITILWVKLLCSTSLSHKPQKYYLSNNTRYMVIYSNCTKFKLNFILKLTHKPLTVVAGGYCLATAVVLNTRFWHFNTDCAVELCPHQILGRQRVAEDNDGLCLGQQFSISPDEGDGGKVEEIGHNSCSTGHRVRTAVQY